MKKALSGWGNYPRQVCQTKELTGPYCLDQQVIARGLGRGYGDCALNASGTLLTTRHDGIESFDTDHGLLIAQSGCSLHTLLRTVTAAGWFIPVTPGTQYVTLGGMIAADVHGKNHHCDGSFGSCVDWIDLCDAVGRVHRISREYDAEWFDWTCGGMGLTGIILRAQIRLRPISSPWIQQDSQIASCLDALMSWFEAESHAPYSVAWVDSSASGRALGRGVVYRGRHLSKHDAGIPDDDLKVMNDSRVTIPSLPINVIRRPVIQAFNRFYFATRVQRSQQIHWLQYFYPLDRLMHWNRLYGPSGFTQFQTVLPSESSRDGLHALLNCLRRCDMASPLTVLKKMGPARGGLSFPMAGYTLTFDLPRNRSTAHAMSCLIDCALDFGGRFYLAKDAYLTQSQFDQSDKRADAFREFRSRLGLSSAFQSELSRRLAL